MTDIQLPWAIEADGISLLRTSFSSADSWLLNDITLRIPTGAVVGLVGRNGAGKSTLIRCLLGLSLPNYGHSRLLGCPSEALSDAVRERLGYVAQTPDLFGWLSGQDHLREMAQVYAHFDLKRALKLAMRLELPLGMRADKLSLGDQQKLAVVLALAHDPDLLLMDEPVSSLDPMSRRAFMRALFAERDADAPPRTVLISSHLLTDLERVVSHVLFLRQGRVQLFGAWDELSEHLVRLPMGTDPGTAPGLVHWSADQQTAVVDSRNWTAPLAGAQAMAMDDLFEALHA
jgi:ABC-2 type transport system ATP-binding protein